MARDYRARILGALPAGSPFLPLMTLYLTDDTTPAEIAKAKASGFVHAIKYYPAGATTHSDSGVSALRRVYPALEAMQTHGVVLSVHGEVTDPDVDIFDRERVFVERSLDRDRARFSRPQGRARAHHDGGGRRVRRGCALLRRGDDHAAAPRLLEERAVRRRHPSAPATACPS